MKTAVEIYKFLPKTNCGKCGTTSCFGFAAKLATHQASPDDCPAMTKAAREELRASDRDRQESPGTVYEQALVSLQPKIQALNFEKTARLFGAKLINAAELQIIFLKEPFRVTKERITDAAGREPRPWISILIYNHLCMPDPPAPAGEWITFSSVPASHAKDKAWAGHVEEEIAKHFAGNVAGLKAACERLGGTPATVPGKHDAAYEFRFFPHYPVLLLFDDAVAEENFPAQCRMLLDKTALSYLDIESIVVLGEEFAGRLTAESV
ncbi:MAG TPA: DUF3786 domain-containing protein [Nitrospirota bacterium]|nr:DUF3786 domain-containing protein [Nitrospirota bacterium]